MESHLTLPPTHQAADISTSKKPGHAPVKRNSERISPATINTCPATHRRMRAHHCSGLRIKRGGLPILRSVFVAMALSARCMVIIAIVCSHCCESASENGGADLELQMRVLSKQVTALLDRRREDLRLIEDSMRKSLAKSQELQDVRQEMRNLKQELEQLRTGHKIKQSHTQHHNNQQKNDHLTIKWLSNAMSELRNEFAELQGVINTTALFQARQEDDLEMNLLRTDVSNLNKELEAERNKNAKREAAINELREEIISLREDARATAVTCGKTKNQLKAAQMEWSYNWKLLQDKKSKADESNDLAGPEHPSRHQRALRKHVLELERNVKHLKEANKESQIRMKKLEVRVRQVQGEPAAAYNQDGALSDGEAAGLEERVSKLESYQQSNALSMFNLSQQLSNYDKLHLSMLELLETVESIESNVDKSLPDLRNEISKLDFQMAQTSSKVSSVREDLANTRDSVRAISVSVSNLKDKSEIEQISFDALNATVAQLKDSSNVQNSKLHDHILKSESASIDLNSTKSTIHLVEELKSFENEYKSIVNKLPHDCSSVSGQAGVYLISPGDGEPIMAACQDGWTTVQKRYDGSVNFNRKWNEYSAGFGSPTGEHWLGNRNLHSLTGDNCTKLQINMKDIYGKYWTATYDYFSVGDFSTGFKLSVAGYKGNASDAMDYQNKMEFSTVDNDRDISNTHCASNYEGGWWFSHCQHANLNGRYNLGLTWFDSSRNEWIAVATTEMKVRRREHC